MKTGALLLITLLSLSLVLAQLDISIEKQTYNPGETVTYKITSSSQQTIEVKIVDSNEEIILETQVQTNQNQELKLEENSARGWWAVIVEENGQEIKRLFNVESNEKAEFLLENNVLIIRNIGNVEYTKPIQITIGADIEIIEPSLEVDEEESYKLVAPDGVYNVKVTDGEETILKNNMQLTGEVIGIQSTEIPSSSPITTGLDGEYQNGNIFQRYLVAWAFIALIVGLFVTMIIQNYFRQKRVS